MLHPLILHSILLSKRGQVSSSIVPIPPQNEALYQWWCFSVNWFLLFVQFSWFRLNIPSNGGVFVCTLRTELQNMLQAIAIETLYVQEGLNFKMRFCHHCEPNWTRETPRIDSRNHIPPYKNTTESAQYGVTWIHCKALVEQDAVCLSPPSHASA